MESRGAEMGEEKNKGKRRERKGREDKRNSEDFIPGESNIKMLGRGEGKKKKKRNSMVGRMKTKKTWSPRTLGKKVLRRWEGSTVTILLTSFVR